MIDIGLSKMALVGVVALIVVGPEKLPRVARTVGTLLGKAQRYVADVKAEVNRSMEMDELRKMKETVEDAARGVEKNVSGAVSDMEQGWNGNMTSLESEWRASDEPLPDGSQTPPSITPAYRNPGKKWRLKRAAVPRWYKARSGVRTHVQSGAARVARFRPRSKPH